ncbi:hypothetical protein AB0O76_40775 [Streptomyces sp. NPDC086554]|uniref:hypothetical protein n=1 Tax=Streptomyces sp. NPDC086554 TaxID=3154864 RepID=UPI0034369239
MIETHHKYDREDIAIEVIYDSGSISPIYLGLHDKDESAEFNVPRQDLPRLVEMLTAALNHR